MLNHRRIAAPTAALLAGLALSAAGAAAADPAAPGDPVAPVAPAAPADPGVPPPPMLALGPLAGLPGAGADFLLSQYAVPSLPGGAPAAPPNADILQGSQFLNPLNYRVPTVERVGDGGSPYQLAPATDPGPFARIEALKGQHAIGHGALGRMPLGELSQPLAGTAPPPGTALPAGPLQNLPDTVPPDGALAPWAPSPPEAVAVPGAPDAPPVAP